MISTLRLLRMPATLAVLSAVPACGSHRQTAPVGTAPSSVSPDSSTQASQSPADWLTVDSLARTVKLALEVTAPPNAPSPLINGLRAGDARLIIPVGWMVQWAWRNGDPASPHSLVVMVQREKIPLEGGRPSFSNAMTRMVTEGLAPGQTDETTFVTEEAGWYWLMCGVPGHALKGEWIELRVDPEATTARVEVKNREP